MCCTFVFLIHTGFLTIFIIIGTAALPSETFWLARVIDILDSGTYKLRYFKQQGATKRWAPGIGKTWYGTCTNASILVAGVNMNEDSTITAASMRLINYVLQND